MNICVIMDNPETPRHPVIGRALRQLRATHTVRLLDVRALSGAQAVAQEERQAPADLYVLKSHAPQALDVARHVEVRGARVINSWAATLSCQDRVRMTQRMRAASLPWPRTWRFATLESMLAQHDRLAALPFPLIVKSRYSYRGDLVARVHNVEQIRALAAGWRQEPIIVQEFVAGDGWDIKLWVIEQQISAARRRSPLDAQTPKEDHPLAAEDVPAAWIQIALRIGRVFNLRLYGVDLLMAERGLLVVDVNSFPGFRGVPGADCALVSLVERLGRERKATA